MFFRVLFTAIFVVLLTTLAELITMPLVGTLVRFRANYAPKGLQLDQEGGAQPHAGPVVPSYVAMLRRVYRLEGWQGLYKGVAPSMLAALLVTLFVWATIGSAVPRSAGRYSAPAASPLQLVAYTAFLTLLGLPVTVLVNRAITTPYRLAWGAPRAALRRLCSGTELHRPWVLYLTPGLLAAKALHLAYIVGVLRTLRTVLLPSADELAGGAVEGAAGISGVRLGAYLVLAGLSAAVLCPLEVLATRVSLQRTHAGGAVPPEDGVEEGEYAGTEDVVGLRSEADPYVGLQDAAKRMVDEEGWQALYRGWWVTLLAGLLSAFA